MRITSYSTKIRNFTYIVGCFFFFSSFIVILSNNRQPTTSLHLEETNPTTVALSVYNPSYPNQKFSRYLKWDYIAEPHRAMKLQAKVNSILNDGEYSKIKWEVNGQSYEGSVVSVTFTQLGMHTVQITHQKILQTDSSIIQETSKQFDVIVKYIRREVRELSDEDREEFLDTLQTVYQINTDDGKAIYGDKYKGIEYFVREHIYGAAAKDCDHWHDDAGMMTHHLAFTLQFERVLQLINPKVSIPYWDYTYDDYIFGSEWRDSVIFDDDWFSPSTSESKTIESGRWAYSEIMTDASEFSVFTNSYSYLRSPWNTNDIPYVTRYGTIFGRSAYSKLPDCESIQATFNQTSIADMNPHLNGNTHGPVHIMIGGQWHNSNSMVNLFFTTFTPSNFLLVAKNLWRQGYVTCPACDESTIECVCYCPDELLNGKLKYDILVETGLMKYISQSPIVTSENDSYTVIPQDQYPKYTQNDYWNELFDGLCNLGHVGEMFTSSSPYDPTFWIIHPFSERLLQWRRLVGQSGYLPFNESWGYNHEISSLAPSDTQLVCDWSYVKTEFDLPICETGTCSGHLADDILPFEDLTDDNQIFTNGEFYVFVDPTNPDLPYIYTDFEMPHCVESGFSLGSEYL